MSRASWRATVTAALIAFIAQVITPAFAQDVPGDAASGRRLAEAWCSQCHAVGPKAAPTQRDAPAFVAVAQMPSTTALSLNAFLRSNHRSMPNFVIARADADDIVAYIVSLKRK
jgi:mono/diheme cytochrome c family protein